jgi:hypothetical protein
MTDQQNHLESALSQQKTVASEIQELNNTLAVKREQFLKLQGIIEYLNSLNISQEDSSLLENIEVDNSIIKM